MTSQSRFGSTTCSCAAEAAIASSPPRFRRSRLAARQGSIAKPEWASIQFCAGLFPIPAVEGLDTDVERVGIVERVQIDAPGFGMRPRLVEALHAADAAEQMLGGARAETIAGQHLRSRQQPEIAVRNDQVPEARRRADRAVAVEHRHRLRNLRLEPHRSAMTSAADLHAASCS